MTTIYVDVLVGLNLFINYFLILAVSRITHVPVTKRRNLLASFLLAMTSLLVLLPTLPMAAEMLLRFAIAAVGVLISYGFPGYRGFLKLYGAFFSVSFGFAGIMLGIEYLFRPTGLLIHNGVVYYNISPVLLVLSTVAAYGIILLLRRHFGKESKLQQFYTLHLQQEDRTITLQAKLDTGFMLQDLYDHHPVVLLAPSAAHDLLDPQTVSYRLLPYETVNGSGFFQSALCKRVSMTLEGKTVSLSPVVAAVGDKEFHAEYKALIGYDFLERMEEKYDSPEKLVKTVVAGTSKTKN